MTFLTPLPPGGAVPLRGIRGGATGIMVSTPYQYQNFDTPKIPKYHFLDPKNTKKIPNPHYPLPINTKKYQNWKNYLKNAKKNTKVDKYYTYILKETIYIHGFQMQNISKDHVCNYITYRV